MRAAIVLIAALYAGIAAGKLPPQTDAAKAAAADTAAKAAWTGKVSAYETCVAGDRAVANYRREQQHAGKPIPTPMSTPPCADPGPYGAAAATQITPQSNKPIEASGAHSPPGLATTPPSSNATASQLQKGTK